jgi:hypothetical protein
MNKLVLKLYISLKIWQWSLEEKFLSKLKGGR